MFADLKLDAVASTLGLIGGILLAVDALRAAGTVEEKLGGEIILQAQKATAVKNPILSEDGLKQWTVQTEEARLARKTASLALFGALFLVAGFATDIVTKCGYNPHLLP